MNNFTFTLIKETTIDIDMEKFIEKVIHLYDYYGNWEHKCTTWYLQLSIIIEDMTLQDTWDYDNGYEVTRQILTNAIVYSRARYDNNSVEILQEILKLLDRNK